MITIYTDGSCIGNPGPGGWAAIILTRKNKDIISGSKKNTTNNQMELMAAIKALEYFFQKTKRSEFIQIQIMLRKELQLDKNMGKK